MPLAILLNLCLALFLMDGVVSLLDNSLILVFNVQPLAGVHGIVLTFTLLISLLVYILIGFSSAIPKRVFLPITLFTPVTGLITLPVLIYFYSRGQMFVWLASVCQVLLGLCVLRYLQGGFKFRWPLVPQHFISGGGFDWKRLCEFALLNVLFIVPVVLVYLIVCAGLAVNHFSDGFVALRRSGFTVQVRKYARNDGKSIWLVPMSHIGEPEFYRGLSQGFPADSAILMEGVTDNENLLTNRITYKRVASSLGLSPQEKQFKPNPSQVVMADIDVDQFTTNTIDFLNLIMLIHSRGLTVENILQVLQYPEPPGFEQQLFDDLLRKRNRHLLAQIQEELPNTRTVIVPWGAAHMPELAREIQKSGFQLTGSQEHLAIGFHKHPRNRENAAKEAGSDLR